MVRYRILRYHYFCFPFDQLEHKIRWKPIRVSLHLFSQANGYFSYYNALFVLIRVIRGYDLCPRIALIFTKDCQVKKSQ